MKKKILFGVLGAVVILLLAVVLAWVMIDSLAKRTVEDGGQYALGVPTTVGSVSLSLLHGNLRMSSLDFGNPAGYKSPHLMEAGHFTLDIKPGSVFTGTIVVPKFELDGLDINIESKDLTNNVSVVLDHVKKLAGGSEQAQQQEQQGKQEQPVQGPESAPGKKVLVRKVAIRNVVAHVILGVPGTPPLTVKVPKIELDNVSSDKGITVDQLISRLMPAIMAAVVESGKGIIPSDMLAGLNTQLASTAGALGGHAAELVQQGMSQADAQVQQALDKVGKAVPAQAAQAVGQVSHQAQDGLGKVQQATVGQLLGGATATQPTGKQSSSQKKSNALEGLFSKK